MIVDRQTKLKDILKTASGHDFLGYLFYSLGLDENLITKTFIGNIKLGTLKTLTLGQFDDKAMDAFIGLINSFSLDVDTSKCPIKEEWWKEAVFYEIYPRSFKDSNNDGIGDINGIISKLDYLKDLGVNALWICPFYDSPNCDNGYDIRDYKAIMKEFGTLDDVKRLFKQAHDKDIKIIIDLVMNHTSDEHEWFKKSVNNIKPYDDYYIWRDKANNWTSFFSGPAWKYFKQRDQYVLHTFAEKQIDLNWDNPKVRQEMYDIANYWLDLGADGFRLDVVSFISKKMPLEDGNPTIGKLISFYGIEHYFHGPNLDKYLKEFNKNCLKPHNAYTVGECPGVGIEMGRYMTGDDSNELSQIFSFEHMDNPGQVRFNIYDYDIRKAIPELVRWQTQYSNHAWPTVFFNNHDNPRMNSKIDKSGTYNNEVSKMLVTIMMTLKGTPYIYEGEEIGMTNYPFKDLSEYRDIETFNMLEKESVKRGIPENKVMTHLLYGSRDHARTPMQWDSTDYAGFSSVYPWINVNPNYKDINVENELNDEDSILNYYKKAIKLRHDNKVLVYGDFKQVKTNKNYFVYERTLNDDKYLVIINLTNKTLKYPINSDGDIILHNYKDINNKLRPYESLIIKEK